MIQQMVPFLRELFECSLDSVKNTLFVAQKSAVDVFNWSSTRNEIKHILTISVPGINQSDPQTLPYRHNRQAHVRQQSVSVPGSIHSSSTVYILLLILV